MSKSSINCPSCGMEIMGDSEFCSECGTKINMTVLDTKGKEYSTAEDRSIDREEGYTNWKQSLPYTIGVSIFLLFIDLATSPGIQWAYWPVVPILLFAVIAPYLSYKMK